MIALAERGPRITPEKEAGVKDLYNGLVMVSAEPAFLPNPAKIDRDFQRIGAMAKDAQIGGLVSDSVVTSLAVSSGPGQAEFVHQLDPVRTKLITLNTMLTQRMRQPAGTIGTMIDTLDHLWLQGQRDPNALDKAKNLLAVFGEAMTLYDPNLRDNPEIRNARTEEASDALVTNARQSRERRALFAPSKHRVVDKAHVHKKDDMDTTTYIINKIAAPEPDLVYTQEFDRNGTTTSVEVLTPEGQPLSYAMTLLVKTDAGEWRPVHLAPPVTGDAYHPNTHLEVQQTHIWTTDLPEESGKYAVVVDATPWHVDGERKESGTIYASLEQDENENQDTNTSQILINAARALNIRLSSIFSQDGAHDGEIRLNSFGAKDLLNKLQHHEVAKLLNAPVSRQYQGRATMQRTSLSFSTRVGVPGNEGTVPMHVLVKGNKGQELFMSRKKDDEVNNKQKNIKATDDEKADRSAIYTALGTDGARTELYFFDSVETHSYVSEYGRGAGEMTATRVATREIGLQPLMRQESEGSAAEGRVTIEVVPFLSQKSVNLPIERSMEPVTVEQLLSDAGDVIFTRESRPQVRITSPQIVAALAEEERIIEEQRRSIAAFTQFDVSKGLLRGGSGSFGGGFTGYGTSFGNVTARGDAEVQHANIVGELPAIRIAVTAELPDIPVPDRIKNSTRRKSLQ